MSRFLASLLVASVMLSTTSNLVYAQSAPSDITYKSVVQVMSYGDIFGQNPVLMGRGSASIISKDGVILTNNHVVSDSQGRPMAAFLVCLSQSINERPKCDYTASLIAKDEKKDVAMLRVDPTDIYGKAVDMVSFVPLMIDYEYKPTAKDSVQAIGYPGIGGETITQTVGVVAGTDKINAQTYIKTDAMIAPGNSGGPMIKDGKIIGVNTLGGGGLGYALSIPEAKTFIDTNLSGATKKSIIPTMIFQSFVKQTRTMYETQTVSDSLFSITFPIKYIIQNYIAGNQIEGRIANEDEQQVQYFSIRREYVPAMKTEDEFLYQIGFRKGSSKFLKKTIGGIEFLEEVSRRDSSQGEGLGSTNYVTKYDDNSLLYINIYTSYTSDNTQIDAIKKNVENFLTGITFVKGLTSSLPKTFTSTNPGFTIDLTHAQFNLMSPLGYWGEYGNFGFATYYFGNSHESLAVSVESNTVWDGSRKTFEENYKIKTNDIPKNRKATYILNGYKGYIVCDEEAKASYSYDEYSEYSDYGVGSANAKGQSVDMRKCTASMAIGEKKDFTMTVEVKLERKNYKNLEKTLLTFLSKSITLPGQGDTNLPKAIVTKQVFKTPLLDKQSDGFRAAFAKLVEYKLVIDSPKTDLIKPITYKQYISKILAFGYNIQGKENDKMADKIVKVAKIPGGDYMDRTYVSSELTIVTLATLAGVTIPGTYSSRDIQEFVILKDTTYAKQRQAMKDYEYGIFGTKKFDFSELELGYNTSYTAYIGQKFVPGKGLKSYENYSSAGSLVSKNYTNTDTPDAVHTCTMQQKLSSNCMRILTEYMIKREYNVDLITYGEVISTLTSIIDLGLVDPERAAKKETSDAEEVTTEE